MESVYPPESNRINFLHRKFKRLEKQKRKIITGHSKSPSDWKKITFPSRIKLIEEPDLTLKYFNLAHKHYSKSYNVDYDLSNVEHFSPESIAVFAACIASEKFTNGMDSLGNMPKNRTLSRVFKDSGFFDHVDIVGGKFHYKSKQSLLHKVTDYKVETEIAKSHCIYMKEKINAEFIDDLEPLYVILVEAMQNTNNHAAADTDVKYDWWLYSFEDKSTDLIHFTFLDIGVGVFNSLSVIDWKRKITDTVKMTSNLDLVDKLLAGQIKSRTLRKDRGKGIPQIYDSSKDDLFETFYILSNDILINTKTDEKIKLKEEFQGTLYYWTMKRTIKDNQHGS